MAKVNISPSKGWTVQPKPVKMNAQAEGVYKAMNSAMKTAKVFGSPMTPAQIAKRNRTRISNAADKVMNSNYSK